MRTSAAMRPLVALLHLLIQAPAMVIQRITGANSSQLAYASSGGGTYASCI
tara:strand:+ start:578 stop:730 length:153 start_codon:yes stop_codon:yes gene_type:complete